MKKKIIKIERFSHPLSSASGQNNTSRTATTVRISFSDGTTLAQAEEKDSYGHLLKVGDEVYFFGRTSFLLLENKQNRYFKTEEDEDAQEDEQFSNRNADQPSLAAMCILVGIVLLAFVIYLFAR